MLLQRDRVIGTEFMTEFLYVSYNTGAHPHCCWLYSWQGATAVTAIWHEMTQVSFVTQFPRRIQLNVTISRVFNEIVIDVALTDKQIILVRFFRIWVLGLKYCGISLLWFVRKSIDFGVIDWSIIVTLSKWTLIRGPFLVTISILKGE